MYGPYMELASLDRSQGPGENGARVKMEFKKKSHALIN